MAEILNWVALLVTISAALGLLLGRDWRLSLFSLALQYLGVFWFVQLHWPVSMAAAKLAAGWTAAAVLGFTQARIRADVDAETPRPEGRLFRLFAGGMIILAAFAAAPRLAAWLGGISLAEAWTGLLLIGMGLLHLGMTSRPLQVIAALLTALAGFEMFYAVAEGASLVAALLAGVNLGLALTGAYLLNSAAAEEIR